TGGFGGQEHFWGGNIDEVRISSTARSAAWIKATYATCGDMLVTFNFSAYGAVWLGGWDDRIKIVIDADQIDEDLVHFPVMIRLSDSCGALAQDVTRVFDALGAEDLKLAVTEADGETELKVEVEKWDHTGEGAILWVSRSDWQISSTVDTVLYLYYDIDHADNSANVGVPGSAAGEAVWNADFLLVDHMRDDPDPSHTIDSTSNGEDGVKAGAGEPLETLSGQVGNAETFDGSNDYITPGSVRLNTTNDSVTMEAIAKVTNKSSGSYQKVMGSHQFNRAFVGLTSYGYYHWGFGNTDDGGTLASQITNGAWAYWAAVWSSSAGTLYIDSASVDTMSYAGAGAQTRDNVVGAQTGGFGGQEHFWGGNIDEVRISSTARSAAWIKATYATCWDELVTFDLFPLAEVVSFTITDYGSNGVLFGSANPGVIWQAADWDGGQGAVTITVDSETNVPVNVQLKGNNFSGPGTIPVTAVVYDDDVVPGAGSALTDTYVTWYTVPETGSDHVTPVYYWISIPNGQVPGAYSSVFYYQAVKQE
ncbi:LamG domain-containing protein, partial [Chloroflexota bacterium]